MPSISNSKTFLQKKKREFTAKRGRMNRSVFFSNAFIVAVLVLIYSLGLHTIVTAMNNMGLPRLLYNNVYFVGVGILFLGIAFGTRNLRRKRLRDMGLPVWADWPFFILLIAHGLGPIFNVLNIPYLEAVEIINMPHNVRDLFGIIWLIWLLVLCLGPSKSSNDPFTRGLQQMQNNKN
ncbi:DUF805 domain-containing protein [Desulfovibrio sp. OttesenSCG-928-F07]|nr:DUF805 domain-containing protein [Desulfovibrio sp. OttesenSCG-928-F07]